MRRNSPFQQQRHTWGFFKDRESELGLTAPEFNLVHFLEKVGQFPQNLAKEDLSIIAEANASDISRIEKKLQILLSSKQWPTTVGRRVEELRSDRWSPLARKLLLPHRECTIGNSSSVT